MEQEPFNNDAYEVKKMSPVRPGEDHTDQLTRLGEALYADHTPKASRVQQLLHFVFRNH